MVKDNFCQVTCGRCGCKKVSHNSTTHASHNATTHGVRNTTAHKGLDSTASGHAAFAPRHQDDSPDATTTTTTTADTTPDTATNDAPTHPKRVPADVPTRATHPLTNASRLHGPGQHPTGVEHGLAGAAAAEAARPVVLDPKKSYEDVQCSRTTSLMSLIRSDAANLSFFSSALHWSGVDKELSETTPREWTIFAPTNKAFARLAADENLASTDDLLANTRTLRALLAYHLVPEAFYPEKLEQTPFINTTWPGHELFGMRQGEISGEGTHANILKVVHACGSYIYYIDYVLMPVLHLKDMPALQVSTTPPPPPPPECDPHLSAWDVISTNNNMTLFTNALAANTTLLTLLRNGTQRLTVLAPDDAAWDPLAKAMDTHVPDLLQNKAALGSILPAHIILAYLPPDKLQNNVLYRSIGYSNPQNGPGPLYAKIKPGQPISFESLGGEAKVLVADHGNACNAAVYQIDNVLRPHVMQKSSDA